MRSWILKKMAFASRHAQKCPSSSLIVRFAGDQMSLTSSFCGIVRTRFSICAYHQYIYMQICGQILDLQGAFSLDAVISPGLHCLWSLGRVAL